MAPASSLQSIGERLRTAFRPGTSRYECTLCAQTFERERLNCPSCGCPTVART